MPDECTICSKRIISRKTWLDNKIGKYASKEGLGVNAELKPLQVDFQLGNKCNLQCRTCGSWGSSNWKKDDELLREANTEFMRFPLSDYKLDVSQFKDSKEMFSNLVRFDFKGGEPMLHDSMIEMIENLIEWENAPNITLAYITNGSLINEKVVKLWSHFKEVRIIISIDGIEDLFSYIRGYDFNRLEKNLYRYDQIENLKGLYNMTVSVYNILDLAEINNWIMTRNLKRFPCLSSGNEQGFENNVLSPPYLDVTILPKKYKRMALERIHKYNHPNILELGKWVESIQDIPSNDHQLKLFVSFTKMMDIKRGTDFLKVKPEFKELFEEYS